MRAWTNFLLESDAGGWAALAIAAVALAIVATVADRRRVKRKDPDRVGCMPWSGLFLLALLVAVVAGLFALTMWLSP